MNKSAPSTAKPLGTLVFTAAFWLWITSALLALILVVVISTAWAVRHASIGGPRLSSSQSDFVIAVAEFVPLVRASIKELQSWVEGVPLQLLVDRKETEQPHWVRRFPAPEDPGYLLFSGLDPVLKRSVVALIRISDGIPVVRWDPDWLAIHKQITAKKFAPKGSPGTMGAVHPLLLADGDIIFNTGSSLVRQSPCSRRPVWVLDEVMHHSIELDTSGNTIWVPSVSQDGFADSPWLQDRIRDDALAQVSIDGRILNKRSFTHILRSNDLEALLLGTSGERFANDPIHLNQISVAPLDSHYWQKGDLLISAKNLSTIFLYRPSTNRIIWYKTGPWMNQHSANFVDDHRISVFNNNVISGVKKEHAFVTHGDTNHFLVYDFDTNQISEPFAALLADAKPVTVNQGSARMLPDGGLFIEETNQGRHLRFTRNRLMWSRINDYDDRRIGAVFWSRYLTVDEARGPLQALVARQCPAVAVQ